MRRFVYVPHAKLVVEHEPAEGSAILLRGDRLLDRRALAGDGSAPHVADFVDVVEGAGAMHGRAVVPDDQIVLLPFMRIDELGTGGFFRQIADQGEAFRTRRADDAADMSREINRFAAGHRIVRTRLCRTGCEILQFLVRSIRRNRVLPRE